MPTKVSGDSVIVSTPPGWTGPTPTVVGSGAIWKDDSDATYADLYQEGASTFTAALTYLGPQTEIPPGAEVDFLGIVTRGTWISGVENGFLAYLESADGTVTLLGGPAFHPTEDFSGVFNQFGAAPPFGVDGFTMADYLRAGTRLRLVPFADGTAHYRVSEVWIEYTYVGSVATRRYRRPLRQFPRSDGLGSSSAPRVDANRSIQRSLRQGPGAYL